MARNADKIDSYISMVLGLNGRVRPADLQSVPEAEREAALSAFVEAHTASMEMHLVAGELFAGPLPDPGALDLSNQPSTTAAGPMTGAMLGALEPAAPSRPADLTDDGRSAVDVLLGDYDGVPQPADAEARDIARERQGVAAEPEASPLFVPAAPPAVVPTPPASELSPELSAEFAGSAPRSSATRAAGAESATPHAEPVTPAAASYGWLLWWIPTLLVPLIGGSAAWFFLRGKRQLAARAMLTVAIVLGLIASVMWLRYAETLGAMNSQRGADSVIVVPSK